MSVPGGSRGLGDRMRASPALHLADQVLSSGTNFLAVVMVARNATPEQFSMFSIFLVTFFLTAGFNRAVPHTIAMTSEWDDERGRSGYFFIPPLALGLVGAAILAAAFAFVDPSWMWLAPFLLPLLLQDAVRMHAFAVQKPQVALLSDAAWMAAACGGFLFASTAAEAAAAWGIGGICALFVSRPWRIRMRLHRRPVRASVVSAGLEYATLTGIGYLTPLLASPIITVLGVGALQGANVIRGPIILLVQGLLFHRLSGPPIDPESCVRHALHLSITTTAVTLLCIPPLLLLRGVYGPRLLGPTWPQVEPLVVPTLLTMVLGTVAFGPATVARKMGRFVVSAKVQGALTPLFLALPLLGAALAGTRGFVYATAGAYAVFAATWWVVLPRMATRPVSQTDLVAT